MIYEVKGLKCGHRFWYLGGRQSYGYEKVIKYIEYGSSNPKSF